MKTTKVNQKTKIKYRNSTILKPKHVQVQLHIPKPMGHQNVLDLTQLMISNCDLVTRNEKNAQGTREKEKNSFVMCKETPSKLINKKMS